MRIYSLLRKKKIESLVRGLSLENEDFVIADCPGYECDGERLFISSSLFDGGEAIVYGDNIRALGENLYADSYDPSVTFSYPDPDSADLAYALCRTYGIDLKRLENIELESDMFFRVKSAKEIRSVISSRGSSLRTLVIFSFDSYDDMHALASAFQNADILFLLRRGGKDEERFKKALDRVIFSPVVKRLSAVVDIKTIDDIINYISPSDAVFEIELVKED